MRMLFKAEWDVEKGNAMIAEGKMAETIQSILDDIKPEAAYFVASNGKRCALIFVDLEEPSQIPGIAEPFFLALNASIEFIPAMVPEDLAKASRDFENAVRKYA